MVNPVLGSFGTSGGFSRVMVYKNDAEFTGDGHGGFIGPSRSTSDWQRSQWFDANPGLAPAMGDTTAPTRLGKFVNSPSVCRSRDDWFGFVYASTSVYYTYGWPSGGSFVRTNGNFTADAWSFALDAGETFRRSILV